MLDLLNEVNIVSVIRIRQQTMDSDSDDFQQQSQNLIPFVLLKDFPNLSM
jgi:hypothetical protein